MVSLREFVTNKNFGLQKIPIGDSFWDLDETKADEIESKFKDSSGNQKTQPILIKDGVKFYATESLMREIKNLAKEGAKGIRITNVTNSQGKSDYTVMRTDRINSK